MLEGVIVAGVAEDQFKLETAFVFCTIWAFGSALMMSDDGVDHRKAFSDWWKTNFKHIRLPTRETTFDYWLDPASNKFEPWRQSPSFHAVAFDSRIMKMDETTVPTTETASISHWGNLFIHQSKPLLLVGPSGPKEAISLADCASCFLLSLIVTSLMLLGTGKTQLVTGMLRELLPTKFVNVNINLNYYSSASVLLGSLEAPLQKRTGSTFGPPGSTRLVYFVGACIFSLIIPYTIPRR